MIFQSLYNSVQEFAINLHCVSEKLKHIIKVILKYFDFAASGQTPPTFVNDMSNVRIREDTPVGK